MHIIPSSILTCHRANGYEFIFKQGDGAIQVRLDSPTGPLVGTATVTSTGSVYTYASTRTTIQGASGRHDVYLVFASGMRLATFSLT